LNPSSDQDELRSSRQVVVVVRLLVDAEWQLLHGELVDVDEVSRARFAGWQDVTPAIQRIVAEERKASAEHVAN
jgi:hypothetical protein